MTDGETLYRAVLAAPADDAPRLVYADWLEERGEAERAELIRYMVHFPRDRAVHGPPRPQSAFWPDAPPLVKYAARRGFVTELTAPTRPFLEAAGEWFARHPITRVSLVDRCPASHLGGARAVIRAAPTSEFHIWPAALFPDHPDGAELLFPSRARAVLALSRAAVAYGRRAAGLPPLG